MYKAYSSTPPPSPGGHNSSKTPRSCPHQTRTCLIDFTKHRHSGYATGTVTTTAATTAGAAVPNDNMHKCSVATSVQECGEGRPSTPLSVPATATISSASSLSPLSLSLPLNCRSDRSSFGVDNLPTPPARQPKRRPKRYDGAIIVPQFRSLDGPTTPFSETEKENDESDNEPIEFLFMPHPRQRHPRRRRRFSLDVPYKVGGDNHRDIDVADFLRQQQDEQQKQQRRRKHQCVVHRQKLWSLAGELKKQMKQDETFLRLTTE